MLPTFHRPLYDLVLARVREPRRFIQVLEEADLPHHYASADAATLQDRAWVEAQ